MAKMDPEAQRGHNNNGLYAPLLRDSVNRQDSVDGEDYCPFETIYDRPLPCCGCGLGWSSFLTGFILPLFWYYGTCLFLAEHYRHDPRERPGLAACAIAALVNTIAMVIIGIVIFTQHKGLASTLY